MKRKKKTERFRNAPAEVSQAERPVGERVRLSVEQLEEVADILANLFKQPVSACFHQAKSVSTETTDILERRITIPDNTFLITDRTEKSNPESIGTDRREYVVKHFAGIPFTATVRLTNQDNYPSDYINSAIKFLKWFHPLVLSYQANSPPNTPAKGIKTS